jgi:hypothetical protein
MKLGLEFGEECLHRLNAVVHVGVDTSNRRFSSFAHWFAERTGKSVAVTYMSNVSRQMSARLGAALMQTPDVIVILGNNSEFAAIHVERLEKIARYVGGLRAIVACCRVKDRWRVVAVVGHEDSRLHHELTQAFPDAANVAVRSAPSG